MLNELSEILNLNKQYLGYLLRLSGKVILREGNIGVVADLSRNALSQRGRKKVYDKEVLEALMVIWRVSGYTLSKHLVINHEKLFEDRISLFPQTAHQLCFLHMG